jgi:hypothetical protein
VLQPLPADEFTAIYTLLSGAKGAAWDANAACIVVQVDPIG